MTMAGEYSTTVDRIMSAALVMVQQRGFSGFSFRDIATVVGIKTASIHYHFPTKPDLALAVLKKVRHEFAEELLRISREVVGVSNRLNAFAGIFDQTFGDGNQLCPFCMVACAQDAVPEFVRSEVEGFWLDGEDWVYDQIELGKSDKTFSESMPSRVSARAFVALMEGAMVTARTFNQRTRLSDAAQWFIAQLHYG